jgi:hypothetical protein
VLVGKCAFELDEKAWAQMSMEGKLSPAFVTDAALALRKGYRDLWNSYNSYNTQSPLKKLKAEDYKISEAKS